jgi:hypothetical protein
MLNRFQTGANKEARTNRSSSWPSKAEARMTETRPAVEFEYFGAPIYKDFTPTEHAVSHGYKLHRSGILVASYTWRFNLQTIKILLLRSTKRALASNHMPTTKLVNL